MLINLYRLAGTLFAAYKTQLAFYPGNATAIVKYGCPDRRLIFGNLGNRSCRTNVLTNHAQLTSSLTGNNNRRKIVGKAACQRHWLQTLAGTGFQAPAAAAARQCELCSRQCARGTEHPGLSRWQEGRAKRISACRCQGGLDNNSP